MAATASSIIKPGEEAGNFLNRMPWYYQVGLMALLTLLLIFATHELLFSSTRTETDNIQQQVETLKASNAKGNTIRQNLAATEQALKEKHDEINRLRDLLPDQVEISKVYDSIKNYVRDQKLELKLFGMQNEVKSEFYTAQPIMVEVTGSYDSLGQFFSRLAFYSRIVSVTEVEIRQAADASQALGRSIESSFIVTAFYISPENLDKLTMKKGLPATAPTPTKGS
jgi:type IV pilus assembly protein PilO